MYLQGLKFVDEVGVLRATSEGKGGRDEQQQLAFDFFSSL